MLLRIHKRYLIRWEKYTKFNAYGFNPFAIKYVFELPKSNDRESGYTVSIDTDDVIFDRKSNIVSVGNKELVGNYYHIDCDSTTTFVAVKTEERVPGKRYKRYHYSTLELEAMFNQLDLMSADTVVAKILVYGGSNHKQVVNTFYCVGKKIGCWLYSDDVETKRRTNSKGVEILGYIKPKDENTSKELIQDRLKALATLDARYEDIIKNQSIAKSMLNYYESRYYSISQTGVGEIDNAFNEIQKSIGDVLKLLQSELDKKDEEIKKIEEDFNQRLKTVFIK